MRKTKHIVKKLWILYNDNRLIIINIKGGNMNKNISKKLITLMLVLTLVLTACSGGGTPQENEDGEKPQVEENEKPETEEGENTEGEAKKIVIVTSPSGVDDGSFNQDNYEGIQDFLKENPDYEVQAIQEQDVAASVKAVADVVGDYDIIVTPGFQFGGISELAVANPEKSFILVDSEPAELDGTNEFDNIYSMMFAEEESGFLAGIAAALETKTGKVAVVNGIAFPSNVNYQFGFESGVNYANKHLGAKAEVVEIESYAGTDVRKENVGGNYVGDFNDESTGKVVGEALLEKGVDIMLVAAGGSGNGVFTAVKEAEDAFVIGCDVDQFDDGVAGDRNIILTSALKNMSINVERSLNRIKDGSFKGENALLKADTQSTGYVKEEGRQQLSEETIKKLDEAYAKLESGEIVPASNFNEHAPDNFPGL